MSKTAPQAAGTPAFAHLVTPPAAAATARGRKAEEDEENKDPSAEEDPEKKPDAEEDGSEEEARAAASRKAEGDDEDDDRDEDDEIRREEESKGAVMTPVERKAFRAAFRRGRALGRKRELARCSAIFSSPAAAGKPHLAATLAFGKERISSATAISLLAQMEAPGVAQVAPTGGLAALMAKRNDPKPGADGAAAGGAPSLAQQIIAVGQRTGTIAK